jgi:hypothetical protein
MSMIQGGDICWSFPRFSKIGWEINVLLLAYGIAFRYIKSYRYYSNYYTQRKYG